MDMATGNLKSESPWPAAAVPDAIVMYQAKWNCGESNVDGVPSSGASLYSERSIFSQRRVWLGTHRTLLWLVFASVHVAMAHPDNRHEQSYEANTNRDLNSMSISVFLYVLVCRMTSRLK